jgi:hypothetical protein
MIIQYGFNILLHVSNLYRHLPFTWHKCIVIHYMTQIIFNKYSVWTAPLSMLVTECNIYRYTTMVTWNQTDDQEYAVLTLLSTHTFEWLDLWFKIVAEQYVCHRQSVISTAAYIYILWTSIVSIRVIVHMSSMNVPNDKMYVCLLLTIQSI